MGQAKGVEVDQSESRVHNHPRTSTNAPTTSQSRIAQHFFLEKSAPSHGPWHHRRCQQRLVPGLNWAFGTLGSTFKNSPSEITQLYQDAMACTVQYGKPLLFFTATCNPDWPEIKAARGPNAKTCNRLELKCTSV
ncbi:BQ5605_C003g02318 [Microbotryum silenes-dioicae]|uniref:BQ5605_C003g02318 protein n=1 Tax=Microbotryum silenes-dioicae TaxID=796604 RepID=A0A2X0M186_9BASI|nr:BQ5605_C003g02318 [Microbotryum silenes-dioicae]